MASESNLLSKLVELVSAFNDASWEALASIGLLRRARKDLAKGLQITIVEESTEVVKLDVSPFIVSMTASGPAKAECSCPAPGVCQHILAAGLHLQSLFTETKTEKSFTSADEVRDEIVLITTEILKSWAGSADYKSGVGLYEKNTLPAVIEFAESVVIHLMPSNTEIRFVPGGGLDGMILPKPLGKKAAVAGILALRKHLGFEVPISAAQQSLVDPGGTPRSKKEILDSACLVLEDAVAVGLTHVSEALAQRLITLAVSAQGAQMPRVSMSLKTVADEVKSILRREARANEARLLLLISRVYALMEAIRAGGDNQGSELAGSFRAQYVEVSEIELAGVGAYTWQTGSGYVGLTVLFWSNSSKEFLSWSYARPEIQRVDARQRFFGEGPWEGTQSPQQVAESTLKLRNARRTANGRLSASTKTTGLVLSKVVPQALDFGDRLFRSWNMLGHYVAGKQPLGLREPNPLGLVVVLQPVAFGSRSFDSINQTFNWEIYDELGESLMLTLPFRDWTKESIRILEQLSPAREVVWRFVVRLTKEDSGLFVEPISILRAEEPAKPVFQLAFDALPQNVPEGISENQSSDDEHEEGDDAQIDEPDLLVRGSLTGVICELNKRLEAIAETGIQNGLAAHRDWFSESRKDVYNFGLTSLARAMESLSSQSSSAVVIKARYLSHLHAQAVSKVI